MNYIHGLFSTLIFLPLLLQGPVNGQGLKGMSTEVRDLTQPPPMLMGNSDNERW
jgi:hypothetical protein